LKTSELQNNKTKNPQNPQEQPCCRHRPPPHQKIKLKTPKMTRRKIKNFGTSKYENKKLLKFTRKKANTPLCPLMKLHTIFFENPQNDKMKTPKLQNFKIVKQKMFKIYKSKAPLGGQIK
jgi:hypothetical protein